MNMGMEGTPYPPLQTEMNVELFRKHGFNYESLKAVKKGHAQL